MFNWLKRKATAKITAVQAAEVDDWTRRLTSMDSNVVASIVAVAADLRNGWLEEHQTDLLLPHLVIHQDPYIAVKLLSRIKGLQKLDQLSVASGYFPWLFTVRACIDLDLLPNTRELWRQLERGFSQVELVASRHEEDFGIHYNIERATEFPQGFTPDPL